MRLSAPFRRQHLISTALELFASQGFEGTTTREIAQRSGVTEAIIFRHFPTKEDLYWAVIEEQCNIRGAVPRLREMLDSDADEVTKFTQIAEDILERNTKDPKLFRLLLFCGLENHELSDRFFQTRISERFEILAEYIRDGIRQGRFRKMDPLIAARGFFGMRADRAPRSKNSWPSRARKSGYVNLHQPAALARNLLTPRASALSTL